VLEQVFSNEYRILGNVRLADIIRVRKGLSKSGWATANNRIDRRHVDFAICDLRTSQVIGIIELDDSSHKSEARQRRDEFKDKGVPE
jgi:very-short-patch-repair endonuclease